MRRRSFLLAPLVVAAPSTGADVRYPEVVRGTPLEFPRDHGSHPSFRTEWWYITGWVRDEAGHDFGVQVTFFRTRPGVAEESKSRFAPTQLLFAHAAIADPRVGALRHEQRAARAGFGLAQASEATTDVAIGEWSLRLSGDTYTAIVAAREFSLALAFTAGEPLMRKARAASAARGRSPRRRASTTAGRSSPSRGRSPSRAARWRYTAARGSIMNGRASTWRRKHAAGTGPASTSTTAAR